MLEYPVRGSRQKRPYTASQIRTHQASAQEHVMMVAAKRPAHRRGAAAVEFAVVFPVLLTLMLGIWEVARMVQVQLILSSAAREGGRQAASGKLTTAEVQKAVLDHLNNEGIQATNGSGTPLTGVAVTVTNNTNAAAGPSVASKLDFITVNVSIPYSLVRWTTLSRFGLASTKLNASAGWYSMRDSPLAVSATIPSKPQ
jgi:Flp pilus assembly protein TadG